MQVAEAWESTFREPPAHIVDLACGSGQSTKALACAFPASSITGVDTSGEMLSAANGPLGEGTATYIQANAERTGLPSGTADIVSLMYGLHEMPQSGRDAVLKEVKRLLSPRGCAIILDIDPAYAPSVAMAHGEPYIWGYLSKIHSDIGRIFGVTSSSSGAAAQVSFGAGVEHRIVIPNHASLWLYSPSLVPSNNVLLTHGRMVGRPAPGEVQREATS